MTEIPDVDTARDRLGSLLRNIRSQSQFGSLSNGKREPRDDDEEEAGSEDQDNSEQDEPMVSPYRNRSSGHRRSSLQKMKFSPGKGPGSVSSDMKKKRRSQKKIIFELRQKAFEIQNSGMEHGLYALCRIWMRGKHTPGSIVTAQPIDRSTVDYDQESLLAAKTITRKSTVRRENDREDPTEVTEETSPADILSQYLPRWRKAKKDWCQQRNKADVEKYGDSLRVLREMYATAQSSVIPI